MNKFSRALLINSARDLIKHKSFLLLILFVMGLDRALKLIVPKAGAGLGDANQKLAAFATWLFTVFPEKLYALLTDYRVIPLIIAAFAIKEALSMWPSSAMRRMHRDAKGRFGLFQSLFALRWEQLAWDAIAVGTVCAVVGCWLTVSYVVCFFGWRARESSAWALAFVVTAAIIFPLGMAGFSYSSKLAVLSKGTFAEKLRLFFKLLTDRRILLGSWLFFTVRAGAEALTLGVLPFAGRLWIANAFARLLLTIVIACPVYSYFKMISFKFFLEMYRPYDLTRQEYAHYYDATDHD